MILRLRLRMRPQVIWRNWNFLSSVVGRGSLAGYISNKQARNGGGVKRVFIAAASSAVVRAGLESLLASSPALIVVGDSSRLSLADERASGTLAAQINELRPDVVIAEFEGRVQEELERLFAGASEGEELSA